MSNAIYWEQISFLINTANFKRYRLPLMLLSVAGAKNITSRKTKKTMYKQQMKKNTWGSRQAGLLLVLFLATVLFAISTYQISDRYNWSTARFASYQGGAHLLPRYFNIEWAYIITAIEFILLLIIFYFL